MSSAFPSLKNGDELHGKGGGGGVEGRWGLLCVCPIFFFNLLTVRISLDDVEQESLITVITA